jgi:hypothetical protein
VKKKERWGEMENRNGEVKQEWKVKKENGQ